MEVSTEKSKIVINSTTNISADIVNAQKFTISGVYDRGGDQFRSSAATLCKDGTCSAEIRIKIASAIAAMARLSRSVTVNMDSAF